MASIKFDAVHLISLIVMLALVQLSEASIGVNEEDKLVCLIMCQNRCVRKGIPLDICGNDCLIKCYCSPPGFGVSKADTGVSLQYLNECYFKCLRPCVRRKTMPYKKCRDSCIVNCYCSQSVFRVKSISKDVKNQLNVTTTSDKS